MALSVVQETRTLLKKPTSEVRKIHVELFPMSPVPYTREQMIKKIVHIWQETAYAKESEVWKR